MLAKFPDACRNPDVNYSLPEPYLGLGLRI